MPTLRPSERSGGARQTGLGASSKFDAFAPKPYDSLTIKVHALELTKEYLDQMVSNLATKKDLHQLATSEELTEVKKTVSQRLDKIESTLSTHTAVLEQLLTEKKRRDENRDVTAERFDRLEHSIMQAGEKLGLDLKR